MTVLGDHDGQVQPRSTIHALLRSAFANDFEHDPRDESFMRGYELAVARPDPARPYTRLWMSELMIALVRPAPHLLELVVDLHICVQNNWPMGCKA